MRVLFSAFITFLPASAFADFPAEKAKERCVAEWADDFAMQAYCLDKQKAGYADFQAMLSTIPDALSVSADRCQAQWQEDHAMQAYCLEKQLNAFEGLGQTVSDLPDDIGAGILANCARKWENDFAMQKYCSEQQVSGWRQVNN
ncbi:MAG: hypothetical protein RH980_18690 [Roseovarius confluentis]|jgi:hypothetical protein